MPATDHLVTLPPFPSFPAVTRYVPLGTSGETMHRICRAIAAHEAISLLIGPPGLGKSLLCHLIANHHRETHDVVILNQTPVTDKESLIRHLLHHMGVDLKSISDSELYLALVDRVCGKNSAPGGLLIVVDESQSLSCEVLEAIRMVTNITSGGMRRVMAVLAGGPKMDERLVDPTLEALVQRVATRCYLHAMNWNETRDYVHGTISSCGSDPAQTITDAAISALHHATGGVPRLINQMMTQAIDVAAESDNAMIDEDVMGRAWSTLQQLPSPMVQERKLTSTSSNVEFGELSDFGDASDFKSRPAQAPTKSMDVMAQPKVVATMTPNATSNMAPSTDDLFGRFDNEVTVELGKPSATRATTGSQRPAPVTKATDLESELHEEIIHLSASIGGEQHRQIEAMDDYEIVRPIRKSKPVAMRVDPQVSIRISDRNGVGAEWLDEHECEPDCLPMQHTATSAPMATSTKTSRPLASMTRPQDDSDMIVVETDIEISPDAPVVWADEPNIDILSDKRTPGTIDFQKVMSRMRASH
jgi:type II secretory pathway predicted ATPase ExeA